MPLSKLEDVLTDLESLATGMSMMCETYLKHSPTTFEECSVITFLDCGLKRILDGLCDTIPDAKRTEGGSHE